MDERKIQEKVADTLLEKGQDKIVIRYLGVKLRFTITPLFLSTLAAVTRYANRITKVDLSQAGALAVLGSAHQTAWPMALAAAHGVLNKKTKRALFSRWLARLFMRKMTPGELRKLFLIIISQSGVEDFFDCTVLIDRMNLARPRTKAGGSKEEKPSGEQSQE